MLAREDVRQDAYLFGINSRIAVTLAFNAVVNVGPASG